MISTINEPRDAFLCLSSALAIFVDSDLFCGLLLTVLGSQSDFYGCRTPRCAYVLVVKTRSFSRFWPVSWTITQFWGLEVNSTIDEPRGASTCRSSTLAVFVYSDPFRGLLLTVLGSQSDFHGCRTPSCAYVLVINNHRFGRFWPISWTITQCFGVPERFPRLTNPGVRLRFGHQHSRFWLILTRFVDYYSPFWGPKAISIVVEPQRAFMCRSSKVTVLADPGPFCGLLLTVLGSLSDFHD